MEEKTLAGHSPECAELPFSDLIPFRTDVADVIIWLTEEEKQVDKTFKFYTAKMASIVSCPKKAKEQWKL